MKLKLAFLPVLFTLALFAGETVADSQDLDSVRQIPVQGVATDGSTQITLDLGVNDDPAQRIMSSTVDSTGGFNVPVKLFPGNNTIKIHGNTNEEQRTVVINVHAPAIRVELGWAGAHQDYDVYVNSVYYNNTSSEGGRLDRDWIDEEDPGIENITYSAASAGLYRVFVNYYAPHTVDANGEPVRDPNTNQVVPSPVPTTVKIFVNEQQVFTAANTIDKPEGGIHDGRGTWSVCTLVVHSGTESGGFRVDEQGFRDILPQKSLLSRIDPKTPFTVDSLTLPSEDDIIYFPVGKSIQVTASGSINIGTPNEQSGVDIIGNFQSGDSSIADVDDLGVITGLKPGIVTISAQSDSQRNGSGETQAVQPNAPPAGRQVAPTSVVFGKSGASNGFDPGPNPPWIMVPLGGTATADNTVVNPAAAAANRVAYSMNGSASVLQAPPTATSPTSVTVRGNVAGKSTVQAKLTGSGDRLGEMVAAVKPRLNKTVAIHQVLLPGQTLANVPSKAELEAYLNDSVYGKQCNVYFTVTRSDVTLNYDTNSNGLLDCGNPRTNTLTAEQQAVITEAAKEMVTLQQTPAMIDVYIVRRISILIPATGLAYPNQDKCFVQDAYAASAAAKTLVMNLCAHEMGHTSKLEFLQDLSKAAGSVDYAPSGTGDITKRLMYHDADGQVPIFLNKSEWNRINKVKE